MEVFAALAHPTPSFSILAIAARIRGDTANVKVQPSVGGKPAVGRQLTNAVIPLRQRAHPADVVSDTTSRARYDLSMNDEWLDEFDALPEDFIEALRLLLEHADELKQHGQIASADKLVGLADDVSDDFLHAVFDQRDLLSRPKRKWYKPSSKLGDRTGPTRLTEKKGICIHHSGVRGGFGPDRRLVKKFTSIEIDYSRFIERSRDLTQVEWARTMALACRYRGEPARKFNNGLAYQAITAPNSVLILNLPFDWVTWASNGANNDYLAYCWDADSRHEDAHHEDAKKDLITVINIARAEGHPIEELTCHCAWTNKPNDPGKDFIMNVIEPISIDLGLRVDWDFAVKGGKSLREVAR